MMKIFLHDENHAYDKNLSLRWKIYHCNENWSSGWKYIIEMKMYQLMKTFLHDESHAYDENFLHYENHACDEKL